MSACESTSTLAVDQPETVTRNNVIPVVKEVRARNQSTRPDVDAAFLEMLAQDLRSIGDQHLVFFSDGAELEQYLDTD